jgi:tRNA nucleotidyltransferase (CCA-adding enzyme)
MRRLQELDLLKFIHPSLTFDRDKEKLFGEMDTVLKWYTLLYKGKYNRVFYYLLGLVDRMSPADVGDLSRRLVASESVRKKLPHEVAVVGEVTGRLSTGIRFMKKSEVYKQLELLSQEGRLFVMAKARSEEVKKAVSNYITYVESFRPLTRGEDLLVMGLKEGPVFKEILEALKEAKIDLNFATKQQELAFVAEYMKEHHVRVEEGTH